MRGQVKCNIEFVLEWGGFKGLTSHKPIWIKCTILQSVIQDDDFVSIVISLGALSQFCNGYMGINCSYIGKERHSSFLVVGLSSLGVPGVPWHTQILADQLTLFQPGGTDYAHQITLDF